MLYKGSLITDASGSLGGITASRNKGGRYFRARTTPVNPNTVNQQVARQAMATLNDYWISNLTQAQRDAYADYAANVPGVNRLGETIQLNGQQWFIGMNQPRVRNGLAIVDDVAGVFDRGAMGVVELDSLEETTMDLTFDDALDWCDEDGSALIVQIGDPVNQTVNFYGGPWRTLDTVDGDSVTPPTSPATIAIAPSLPINSKAFFRVRISRADGRLSTPQVIAGIVT